MRGAIAVLFMVFVMAAFSIGISLSDEDLPTINEALDNSSIIMGNLSTIDSQNPYMNGMLKVFKEFTEFSMTLMIEVFRVGILFGHDNPQYFETDFILMICKLLLILLAVSISVVPLMYLLAFLIVIIIWIKRKFFR